MQQLQRTLARALMLPYRRSYFPRVEADLLRAAPDAPCEPLPFQAKWYSQINEARLSQLHNPDMRREVVAMVAGAAAQK
jgi:hypothetical protein